MVSVRRCLARSFMCFSLVTCTVMFVVGIYIMNISEYDMFVADHESKDVHTDSSAALNENIHVPILIWWTPLTGEKGQVKQCGEVQCFFTVDRHYRHHKQTKAFIFYGTDVQPLDLPLPKKPGEEWSLLHEESPKNAYFLSHEDFITVFNHTSTFRRESDQPITTQWLPSIDWLESKRFMVSTGEKNRLQRESSLSPLFYTHSDCDPPSDRDSYVRLLQKHIPVDSYGKCVHNKDLPEYLQDPIEGMEHKAFYKIQAKYKFTLAFENGICDDYITEKIWRPLMLGSVPIIYSSPKIKDFLPDPHSAILLSDFASVDELAEFIKKLDQDDEAYEKYLRWKDTGVTNERLKKVMADRIWGINNDRTRPNFIDSFECVVCNRIHENMKLKAAGKQEKLHQAKQSHYGCPRPRKFDRSGRIVDDESWGYMWDSAGQIARAFGHLVRKNEVFTKQDLYSLANSYKKRFNIIDML